MILAVAAWSVPFNQQILGIDYSHSKCVNYRGQQKHLVRRGSNLQNVTIAFALVEAEEIVCYDCFSREVTEQGSKRLKSSFLLSQCCAHICG